MTKEWLDQYRDDHHIWRDEFNGCCAISILHALGSAEGISRAPSFEVFASQIWDSYGDNDIFVSTTNEEQTCERRWLRRLGWKTVRLSKNIYLHHISITRAKEFQTKIEQEFKKEKPKVKPKVKKQKFSYVNNRMR